MNRPRLKSNYTNRRSNTQFWAKPHVIIQSTVFRILHIILATQLSVRASKVTFTNRSRVIHFKTLKSKLQRHTLRHCQQGSILLYKCMHDLMVELHLFSFQYSCQCLPKLCSMYAWSCLRNIQSNYRAMPAEITNAWDLTALGGKKKIDLPLHFSTPPSSVNTKSQ